MELLTQLPCLLRGHDSIPGRAEREYFLRCIRCGRRSAGWQLPAVSLDFQAIRKVQARPVVGAGIYFYRVTHVYPDGCELDAGQPPIHNTVPAAVLQHWDRTTWVARDERQIIH